MKAKKSPTSIKIACDTKHTIALEQLHEFQGDLKELDDGDAQRLRTEILATGFAFPIYVWKDPAGTAKIVGGHQRKRVLLSLQEEGFVIPPVPVVYIEAKNEAEARRRVLQDVAQYGKVKPKGLFDFQGLAKIDFPNLASSFRLPDIDMQKYHHTFFPDVKHVSFDAKYEPVEGEDDAPEAPTKSKVRLGDRFQLGAHLLICGDSTRAEIVSQVGKGKAAATFTDPPYNVGYEGNNWSSGKIKTGKPDWEGGIKNDAMDDTNFKEFVQMAFKTIDGVVKPGGAIYICYPPGRDGWSFVDAWRSTEWHFQTTLVWLKSHLLISRWDYHPIYEPILYGWKPGAPHSFHGQRNQSCVLEHKSAVRQGEAGFHPTQKPVSLIQQAIQNSTQRSEIVFDPFSGSGSTFIACEKTERICYGIELDPAYCSVILDRWSEFTKKDPKRSDGKLWSKIRST